MYNYLIVGAGLYGAVFAREAMARGKSVLVIDRWDYANRFTNAPVTNYMGELYSLPFNMYKFGL